MGVADYLTGFDYSFTLDGIVDGITDFGSAILEDVDWVADEIDGIFGEGVAASSFKGALLGGGIAAITGEDIWKGVGVGTIAGGGYQMLDNQFDFFGSDKPADTKVEINSSTDPVSGQSVITQKVKEAKVPLAQSVTLNGSDQSDLTYTNQLLEKVLNKQTEDTTRTDGIGGFFNFTDKEKRDGLLSIAKTAGSLGVSYYANKMAQEDADKKEQRDYERTKKKYQEDVVAPSARPKISSSFQNDSQSSSYRSKY